MAIVIPIISEFNAKGIKKAVKEFKQLEGAGAKAGFVLKKAMVPATAALGGLAVAAVDFAKAAAEDQLAADQLGMAIKKSTGATNAQIKSVEDWITTTSMAAAVADDELRPALGKLVRASDDVARAQELLQIGLDVSAATGKDLESVTTALAKAEMGNYNALKKLGIPVGENTAALIEMAKESKNVAKAQQNYDLLVKGGASHKEVAKAADKLRKAQEKLNGVTVEGADFADDLNKKFKGAADTAANSASGGFKKLNIAVGEAKESIGAALLPVVQAVVPYLAKMAEWAQKNPGAFKLIAGTIAAIAASIMAVNAAIAITPLGWIIIGIGLLVAGLIAAYKKFEWFRKGVKYVFDGIKIYIETVVNAWIWGINKIIDAYNFLPFHKDIDRISKIDLTSGTSSPVGAGQFRQFEQRTMPAPSVSASAMGASMGTTIQVNVNGADPNAVVQTLRRYVRQTGSLPVRTANIG